MKIPVKFLKDELHVHASFNAQGYHGKVQLIDFVVDTGTSISMISYGDAVRMNLPISNLHSREPSAIAGFEIDVRILKDVRLGFITAEGGFKRFDLNEFFVMTPLVKKPLDLEKAKQIPSLLGLDFLRSNNLSFFCNPGKELAYFDDSGTGK